MPLGRFKVEALNTNTGQSQEVMVKARGIAEAEDKVAALGFAVGKAVLVEVLDDDEAAPPVRDVQPTRVPLPTDWTMCPNCGANDWKSGKGAGAWTIAFLFFPLGLIAPLVVTSRHQCAKCKYEYRSSATPIGRVRDDGGVIAGFLYALVIGLLLIIVGYGLSL